VFTETQALLDGHARGTFLRADRLNLCRRKRSAVRLRNGQRVVRCRQMSVQYARRKQQPRSESTQSSDRDVRGCALVLISPAGADQLLLTFLWRQIFPERLRLCENSRRFANCWILTNRLVGVRQRNLAVHPIGHRLSDVVDPSVEHPGPPCLFVLGRAIASEMLLDPYPIGSGANTR
jgi:hypothetical protein